MGNIMMEILWTVFIKMKSGARTHTQIDRIKCISKVHCMHEYSCTYQCYKYMFLNGLNWISGKECWKRRTHTNSLMDYIIPFVQKLKFVQKPSWSAHFTIICIESICTLAGDVILIIINLYKLGQIHNININIYVFILRSSFFILFSASSYRASKLIHQIHRDSEREWVRTKSKRK